MHKIYCKNESDDKERLIDHDPIFLQNFWKKLKHVYNLILKHFRLKKTRQDEVAVFLIFILSGLMFQYL